MNMNMILEGWPSKAMFFSFYAMVSRYHKAPGNSPFEGHGRVQVLLDSCVVNG